jgi:predicted RND superfamily exporter protein
VFAFGLVALLSTLVIGRLRETALAVLPLGLGALWTIGLMALCGQPFNLANVFGFPLIVGAGAEYGVNIVLRAMEEPGERGPLVPRSTAVAVLVNGLTTIVGFGSMMLAQHRGIFGLGLTLTVGTVATLAAALLVLPVAMRWSEVLAGRRADDGRFEPAVSLGET